MKVLVAFASRRGATEGIAARIAETLEREGLEVTFKHVDDVGLIDSYEAFVVGSSAYMGHWEKSAQSFIRRYADVLSTKPLWLFSSGPVGTDRVDAKGNDVMKAAEPKEFAEFEPLVRPRGEQVFFGAYDPDSPKTTFAERLVTRMPAIREAMPAGDFREWSEIEKWAQGVARELRGAPLATPA